MLAPQNPKLGLQGGLGREKGPFYAQQGISKAKIKDLRKIAKIALIWKKKSALQQAENSVGGGGPPPPVCTYDTRVVRREAEREQGKINTALIERDYHRR